MSGHAPGPERDNGVQRLAWPGLGIDRGYESQAYSGNEYGPNWLHGPLPGHKDQGTFSVLRFGYVPKGLVCRPILVSATDLCRTGIREARDGPATCTYLRSRRRTRHRVEGRPAVNIAQPALSRQITALEQEFGLKLFDRVGRRLVLTGEGEQLLDDCQRPCSNFVQPRSASAPNCFSAEATPACLRWRLARSTSRVYCRHFSIYMRGGIRTYR